MAENVILSKFERSFSYNSTFGAYASSVNNPTFSLVPGQEYRIVWDDVEYTRTAFAFTFADGSQCVGVGNPLAAGQTANDDKFCIVYDDTHKIVHYLSLEQTASHEVAIYQIVEDEQTATGATVVLKDRNGNDLPTFEGVVGVDLIDADGNSQAFLPGEVEEKTVELDFSNDDIMTVVPSEGKLLTKVEIVKPETLVPENLPKDVNAGGVVGTHECSGGETTGGVSPCMFTKIGLRLYHRYYNGSTTDSLPVTITLPANCIIHTFVTDGQYVRVSAANTSASGSFSYGDYNTYPTITRTDTTTTLTNNEPVAGTSTTYRWVSKAAYGVVVYSVPGIFMKQEDNGYCIYADETVTVFPDGITPIQTRTKVDLSNSKITTVRDNAFYIGEITEIILPETVTHIGAYACRNTKLIDGKPQTIDCSRLKIIPTLGSNALGYNSIIKVPSALYDDMLADSAWSEYADLLVAV